MKSGRYRSGLGVAWGVVVLVIGLAVGSVAGHATAGVPSNKAGASVSLPKDDVVIAEVNGEKITVGQLRGRMRLSSSRHLRVLQGGEDVRHGLLNSLIQERLILQHMVKRGSRSTEEFRSRMVPISDWVLGNTYANFLWSSTPTDNDIRPFLPEFWKSVDIRVYYGESFRDASRAREEALGGGDFAKIIREGSRGPAADEGGLVRRFEEGSYFPDSVERLLMTKEVGWVSPVYQNDLGYYFVRIEEVRPYSNEEIKNTLASAEASAKEAAMKRITEEILNSKRVEIRSGLVAELGGIPPSLWEGRFAETVALLDGEQVTVRDLYRFFEVSLGQFFPNSVPGGVAKQLENFLKSKALAKMARKRGMEEAGEVAEYLRQYEEKILIQMFSDEIARNVSVSEREARTYFSTHRETWKKPEGRDLSVIAVREEKTAREVAALASGSGVRFEDLARRYSKDRTGPKGGAVGVVYRKEMPPDLEQEVFRTEEGGLAGPLRTDQGVYLIFRVNRKVLPVSDPRFEDHSEEARDGALKEKTKSTLREKKEQLFHSASVLTYANIVKAVEWPADEEPSASSPHGNALH